MCAQKRKTVGVPGYVLGDFAPSAHRMTRIAVASQLPAVDIRMTVGTLRSYLRKIQVAVALPAGDSLVHALQLEARGPMIKIGRGTHRFPAGGSMTSLAIHFHIAMRARALLLCAQFGQNQIQACNNDAPEHNQKHSYSRTAEMPDIFIPNRRQWFLHGSLPVLFALWHAEHSCAVGL